MYIEVVNIESEVMVMEDMERVEDLKGRRWKR